MSKRGQVDCFFKRVKEPVDQHSMKWGPFNHLFVQVNNQKQFVVVCGNVNYGSITNFLGDFYHPAREDVNCEVL